MAPAPVTDMGLTSAPRHAYLILVFFMNQFTDIFTEDLRMEGEINIKIKYITSTLHLIKVVRKIFYNSKTAKIEKHMTNIILL